VILARASSSAPSAALSLASGSSTCSWVFFKEAARIIWVKQHKNYDEMNEQSSRAVTLQVGRFTTKPNTSGGHVHVLMIQGLQNKKWITKRS
jgi:hypothetical protein